MLNLEREAVMCLRHAAILATFRCTKNDFSAKRCFNH
jgi:hypothetical protein